jgi:16S rRNA (cytosine1402-N4)-methyltransferase
VQQLGTTPVSGVLFDLGVSSPQLDRAERGFSYRHDAPLDMRMDQRQARTAADIVNATDEHDLAGLLRSFGDERYARRIAKAIVAARPIATTAELAEIVRSAIPAPARRTGGHPAKRTFQALRIEVNDELGVLRRAIPAAVDAIGVGGRVVVMSYHSLEDRITKHVFARATRNDLPPDLPFVPEGHEPPLRLVTRGSGAEKATPAEIEANPRAASVRLRAVERVHAGAVA